MRDLVDFLLWLVRQILQIVLAFLIGLRDALGEGIQAAMTGLGEGLAIVLGELAVTVAVLALAVLMIAGFAIQVIVLSRKRSPAS